jgi:hypothetical protein
VRARSPLAFGATLSLALIAGCGGAQSNGVASKPPDQILASSKAAATSAKSVHLSGSLVSKGTPVSVNLGLVAGGGAAGQISEHGAAFQFVTLDGTIYVSGDGAFLRRLGGIPASQLFLGRWLKAPLNSAEFASLSSLVDMQTLLSTLLSSHGPLRAAGARRVHGQQAVAVTDPANGETVYVATTGKPYPLEVAKSGSVAGRIVFEGWNVIVPLSPPANAINIGPLEHT